MSNSNIVVLVTGGSGFIGSHVVHRLLQKGYTVRTTVRSLSKSDQVIKQVIPNTNPALKDRLSFFEVDLLSDKGWKEATSGIDYLLHVASPFPSSSPKDENELIKPAVEGTLRALRFAKENEKTKRVIITSSVAAIAYGHDDYTQTLDEQNWSDPSKPIGAYIKSKTLAEKSAWEYANDNGIPMATVNPVLVIGPLLPGTKDIGTSIDIIKKIANGGIPAAPVISVGVVDVRDVAEMHLRAMERDDAKGKRFLATTGQGEFTTIQELGKVLGKNVWILPDFVVKFGAWFSTSLAELAQGLGHTKKTSNKQAREVLGIDFIPLEQSVKDTVESLKQEGML